MGKLSYLDVKTKEQAFVSLTSLTVDEFEMLVPEFEKAFQAHMSKWCLDGQLRSKRSYTTYQNCPLPTAEDRLLFILSYLKSNPLQSNHGVLFGMGQGKTNRWLHVLLPVLQATCRNLGVAPSRSLEELAQRLSGARSGESDRRVDRDDPPPLFVMMAPNDASRVPKMTLNRRRLIAARNERIP